MENKKVTPLTFKGHIPRRSQVLLEVEKDYYITELMELYDRDGVEKHIELKIDWERYRVKSHSGMDGVDDLKLDDLIMPVNQANINSTKHFLEHPEHPNKVFKLYKLPPATMKKEFDIAKERYNKLVESNNKVTVKAYIYIEAYNIISVIGK